MTFDALAQILRQLNFREAVWLFPPVFALHVLEEAPQFTVWVNRYASKGFTQADFIRNNALGMVSAVLLCALVSLFPNRLTVFLFFALVVTQAVFNTLFHVGTTAAYGAYSPGVITSLVLYPPLFYYLSRLPYHEGLLTNLTGALALFIGGALHARVVVGQVYSARWI